MDPEKLPDNIPAKDQIAARVRQAKSDSKAADALISDYMPFIKSETSKFINRAPAQSDDELSIAMFAFYEAIRSYSMLRGSFLKFAAMQIKSRLIDYYRREKRSRGIISLDTASSVDSDDRIELIDTIKDDHDDYAELEIRDATKHEIEELSAQMADFGLTMDDIADNSPKQERTLRACQEVISYARQNPDILQEFLRTKRVPMAKLAEATSVERKTLERHRRYLAAVLLICTNGYEILRGHIKQVLNRREKQ